MKPNSNSKSNAKASNAQSDDDLLAQLAEEEEGVSPPSEPQLKPTPSEPKLKSKINLVKEFEAAAADGRTALERVRIDASETAARPLHRGGGGD